MLWCKHNEIIHGKLLALAHGNSPIDSSCNCCFIGLTSSILCGRSSFHCSACFGFRKAKSPKNYSNSLPPGTGSSWLPSAVAPSSWVTDSFISYHSSRRCARCEGSESNEDTVSGVTEVSSSHTFKNFPSTYQYAGFSESYLAPLTSLAKFVQKFSVFSKANMMFNEIKKKYLLKKNIKELKAESTSSIQLDIFPRSRLLGWRKPVRSPRPGSSTVSGSWPPRYQLVSQKSLSPGSLSASGLYQASHWLCLSCL